MRVLHLISSGGLYGAEAVILQLSGALNSVAADASQIGVFAHADQPDPELYAAAVAAGLTVHRIPCRGQLDFSVAGALRSLTARVGADVIHAHGYKADMYAFAAFRRNPRPALVSTCHTWYDNDLAVRLYGAADRWVLRSFEEVVAVSVEVRERLRKAGVPGSRTHLINNGVTVAPLSPRFPPDPRPDPLRGAEAPLRVGLVGRLAPEKGVDLFLRAAAEVAGEFPAARFVVAGEGPERSTLEALLHRLDLRGQLELLGQQADMSAFYRSLDVLVSASRQEGLPMALLEGMRAGLPVVATTVGEVAQVVVEGKTGLLVPPEQPASLAEAIRRLLADETLRRRLGEAGRQRIADEFSAERMAGEYLTVYRKALARRDASAADHGAGGAR